MSGAGWKTVEAIELLDTIGTDGFSSLVPRASGLYLWRRRFKAPSAGHPSPADLLQWISDLADQPAAATGPRAVTHCVSLADFRLGGGGLTDAKRDTLRQLSSSPKIRAYICEYVEGLSDFSAPLYIGQTSNISKRVVQHLNGETGLLSYLENRLGLGWDDLEFRYLVLSSRPDEQSRAGAELNELLELIAQRLLSPFGTERAG